MSQKTTNSEKAKAALDTISFSADVNKIRLGMKNKDLVRFGLMTEEEAKNFKPTGFSKGLAKAGAIAGVVTGFIDFYLTADAFGKNWCLDQNYAVAAVEVVAGLGAAVGITAGVFGLIWGEAVSGPVGWIALALTLLGLLTAWLIKKFTRNKFEEVANYSFLGRQHVRGRSEQDGSFRQDYFYGPTRLFSKNLLDEWRAITALLSAFKLDAGYADARYGKITVTPGWVQPKTIFRFKWEFQFLEQRMDNKIISPAMAVLIEVALKVSDLTFEWHEKYAGLPQGMAIAVRLDHNIVWEESETENKTKAENETNHPAEAKADGEGEENGEESESGGEHDGIPKAKSITLEPVLTETRWRERLTPDITIVMVQVDVLGDGSVLLPFNDEDSMFEVQSGFLSGRHTGWLGYRVTAQRDEVHTAVPLGI